MQDKDHIDRHLAIKFDGGTFDLKKVILDLVLLVHGKNNPSFIKLPKNQ